MNTPTPMALRNDLGELLNALAGQQGRAVRAAIVREVFALFDATTARPAPKTEPSDTNGFAPEDVERALFREPAPAELITMRQGIPNGLDPEARQ